MLNDADSRGDHAAPKGSDPIVATLGEATPLSLAHLRTLAPQLLAYMRQQRWFGAAGETTHIQIADVTQITPMVVWTRIYAEPAHRLYQVPLALVQTSMQSELPAHAIVAPLDQMLLVDACHVAQARQALWDALQSGQTFDTTGGRWCAEVLETAPSTDAAPASRLLNVEQSNTSMVFGSHAILKLFRSLEAGANPDLEMGSYLTQHTPFTHTAGVIAAWRFVDNHGQSFDAGMLQHFVANSGDGWATALAGIESWLRHGDTPTPFVAQATELGRITRQMHDALAAPTELATFAPRRAQRSDVQRWQAAAQHERAVAWTQLAQQVEAGTLPEAVRTTASKLLTQAPHADATIERWGAQVADDAGLMIRHHGDYHLGQVLATGDSFAILDFEGEPLRPLSQRRDLHSALRDVAGMLRSLAYAAATGELQQPTRATQAAAWHEQTTAGFMHGYMSSSDAVHLLPATSQGQQALLSLFVLEKAFYELRYELTHRPTWVGIPLRGIEALLYK